jgi:hypothetical protein
MTPPPLVCAIDAPEQDGGLMFGDPLLGLLLCGSCLTATEADGPWSSVERLDVAA